MSSSSSGSKAAFSSLLALTSTSQALITQYLTVLNAPPSAPHPATTNIPDPPNPLQVLKDSALLLKSHTTKLSLLLLNKPFTPSAVEGELKAVTGTCLPAMMSAVELASTDAWGKLVRGEVLSRVRRAVREVGVCAAEVKAIAEAEAKEKEVAGRNGERRDTLSSTGVVWEACDELVELEALDVGGLALEKALGYQELLKDALLELKEWGQDEGDEEEEDGFEDEDNIFGGADRIPKDRPELKALLLDATSKLKKVEILFTAAIKRRVRTFTKDKARFKVHVQTMDALVDKIKAAVEATDEVAAAFYDLDDSAVEARVKEVVLEALGIIKLVRMSWDDTEDEFTTWSGKWVEAVK